MCLFLMFVPSRVNAEKLLNNVSSANGVYLKTQSTSERKNAIAKKKYKEFLDKNSSKYKYFQILNCGKGKTPVLLVTNRLYDPYGKGAKTSDECKAYNLVKGKVVYVGFFRCRATECIRYAYNRICCRRLKSVETYIVKGKGLIKKTTNAFWGNEVKCIVFKSVQNDKIITKQQAVAKVKKIFGRYSYLYAYLCFNTPVTYKGEKYYVIYVKVRNDSGLLTTITQYLVSTDGSICREGYYYGEGNIGFY